MHSFPPINLLEVWEEGSGHSPDYQALLLLKTMYPDQGLEELALLPVGRRDEHLLDLRSRLFGPELNGIASCPECSEYLELHFSVDEIKAGLIPVVSPGEKEQPDHNPVLNSRGIPHYFDRDGYEVQFHLPTTRDITGLKDETDPLLARKLLISSCIGSARKDGEDISVNDIPESILSEITKKMSDADPFADIRIDLACPSCKHKWEHLFDIAPFLWTEIDTWARRTLIDVHILASRYGWSEASILSMSPWKRQCYIGMDDEL